MKKLKKKITLYINSGKLTQLKILTYLLYMYIITALLYRLFYF